MILERPFLVTVGACEEAILLVVLRDGRVLFPSAHSPSYPYNPRILCNHMIFIASRDISRIECFHENGIPQRRFSIIFEPNPSGLASAGGTFVHPRMVVDITSPLDASVSPPPPVLLSTI